MSEGARQKLVRQRRMRLLSQDGSDLRRVSQSTLLPQGARLLIPKDTSAWEDERADSQRSSTSDAGQLLPPTILCTASWIQTGTAVCHTWGSYPDNAYCCGGMNVLACMLASAADQILWREI